MKDELQKLYLSIINKYFEQIKNGEMSIMCYKQGEKYEESKYRLMYVGRFINGWNKIEVNTAQEMFKYSRNIEAKIEKFGGCVNRSAFWQLCKKIIESEEDNGIWHEKIVWSNLFKIGPKKGGNPSYKVRKETAKECIEI